MLLFHGTGGELDLLDSVFATGLVPAPRHWAHEATGIESHVFACTTPIGTRGGDPIAFAQRRAWKARAWLIVIDLPPAAEDAIHGAVANDELERWWKARAFAGAAFAEPAGLRAVIAAKRQRGVAARELLAYRVRDTLDGLCDGEPDPHTLIQFEQAYIRARPGHKRRVAASYGLHVPDWFLDDSHYATCIACMHQLFDVDIVAPAAGEARFHRGSFDRLDLATFGVFVDAVDRWLAAHGDPRTDSLAQLQALPPPRDAVPRVMWRDFATADLAARIRAPDTQVLLGPVAPAHIAGAIDLGAHDRLSALVRPADGETLLRNLEHLARRVVDQRRRTGRPAVLR